MPNVRHAFQVSVDRSPLSADVLAHVESVSVQRAIHLPDQFTIQIADSESTVTKSLHFRLGAHVAVWLLDEGGGAKTRVIEGEVNGINMEIADAPTLTITGFDFSHRLTRGEHREAYREMTDAEIVRSIASRHRLTAKVASTKVRHEYLLQTVSDYAFLDTRAAQLGFEWWVDGEDLHFASKSEGRTVDVEWGNDVHSLNVRATSATRVNEVAVRVWDENNQAAIASTETVGVDATTLGVDARSIVGLFSNLPRNSAYQGQMMTNNLVAADSSEAQLIVEGAAKQAESGQLSISCEVESMPSLRPGMSLAIRRSPGGFDGKYHVVSVAQSITKSGFTARAELGPAPQTELADVVAQSIEEKEERSWSKTGFVVAKVSNIDDPDGLGRVKVLYPTLGDKDESDWARVVSPGGGDGRGLQLIPEVDDEVVVGFQHGDTRAAFVIGGVWSPKVKPPRATSEAVDNSLVSRRTWTSRTGHKIELFDGPSEEEQGVRVELSDSATTLWLGLDKVELSTPKNLTIKSGADISIEAKDALLLKGKSVTIEGVDSLKASAKNADIGGSVGTKIGLSGASTEVGASGELKMSGGASANVSAPMVKLN